MVMRNKANWKKDGAVRKGCGKMIEAKDVRR